MPDIHIGDASVASQPIISAESVKAMQSPQVTTLGPRTMGLTWGLERIGGVQSSITQVGQQGRSLAYNAIAGTQFAIAVFTNAQHGGLTAKAIADKALELYLGI